MLFFIWKQSLLASEQWSFTLGLSLMIALSECHLQKVECKARMEALNYKIAQKSFSSFVYDSHAPFQQRSHADKLLEILSKQDPATNIKLNLKIKNTKFSRH